MLPPVSIESLDLWFQVQHSPFWTNWNFLFSRSKGSDANIGIIANLV